MTEATPEMSLRIEADVRLRAARAGLLLGWSSDRRAEGCGMSLNVPMS